MTAARSLLSAALAAVFAATCACATPVTEPPRRVADAPRTAGESAHLPSRTLAEIVGSYHRQVTPYFPFAATERGLRGYDHVFANDLADDYREGLARICGRHRDELRRIDPAALGEQDRLTREIFDYSLGTCVERLAFPWHLMPVDQLRSWPNSFPQVGAGSGRHPFRTVRNYDDFLRRIDGFVAWVDTAIATCARGSGAGSRSRAPSWSASCRSSRSTSSTIRAPAFSTGR